MSRKKETRRRVGPYRIWFFNSTFGYLVTDSTFKSGVLEGNQMLNTIFAVNLGGGARFHFTERLSMAGTFGLIYAHVDNEFKARDPELADQLKRLNINLFSNHGGPTREAWSGKRLYKLAAGARRRLRGVKDIPGFWESRLPPLNP